MGPQRNYFFLPQTAPAATDRPAAQLLPHNARGLLIGNRRHRPPRSATTSFCHRPPPPPELLPVAKFCNWYTHFVTTTFRDRGLQVRRSLAPRTHASTRGAR